MRFGLRVLLMLFFGVLVALIPPDSGEGELGATALLSADVPAARSSEVESAGSMPDGLVLFQALAIATPPAQDSTTPAEAEVLSEVLVAEAPTTTVGPPAPNADQVATTEAPASNVETTTTTALQQTTTAPPVVTAAPQVTTPPVALSIDEQMLALVDFDWEAAFPEWEVEFLDERPSVRGLTYPGEKRIELFIRSDDTAETLLRVFTHELGHVVDVEFNTNQDRDRWREQRGIDSDVPWWPSAEAPDFQTGAGDFAEAFAVLETGITSRSSVSAQPSQADLALLRELMAG